MAAASGVRAGQAYVELSVSDSKLMKGLRAAAAQVKDFGAGMATIGFGLLALGAGIVAPLIAAAKSFADAGDALGKLQDKTGLGIDGLNGLVEAARQADVPIEELSASMGHLQKSIGGGSKETEAAFTRLGTSAEELKSKSPEAALALLADRLMQVTDLNEKGAIAMTIFGKSGAQLLPVLAAGSKGLNDAANAARESGTAMSQSGLDAAKRLDDGFKSLEGSAMNLRNALGEALESGLIKMINGLKEAGDAVARWVAANPEQVQAIFNTGIAVGALGAAMIALGLTIVAALTPAVLITVAIAGIGLSLLALLDVLGVTETGFGKLFDSVRIGGTGLAMWFAAFATGLAQIWNQAVLVMGTVFDGLVMGVSNAADSIYQQMVWVPQKLLEAFRFMVNGIGKALGGLAEIWNNSFGNVAGKINVKSGPSDFLDGAINGLQGKQNEISARSDARRSGFLNDTTDNARIADLTHDNLQKEMAGLFAKDANPNAPENGIDTAAAKDAFAGIGANIGNALQEALGQIPGLLGADANNLSQVSPFKLDTGAAGVRGALDRHVDVAGAFNASAAGEMGFGSSLAERAATAAEKTARNTTDSLNLQRANQPEFS